MKYSTQILLLAGLGLMSGCASQCKECRRTSVSDSRNISVRRDDFDDDRFIDDPIREQLENALLQQNAINGLAGNANLGAFGASGIGNQGINTPGLFDQNNLGQGLFPGQFNQNDQGLIPSGTGQQQQPAVQADGTGVTPQPTTGSTPSTVASEAPIRRLQAIVDTSTHGGAEEGRLPVIRRTAGE